MGKAGEQLPCSSQKKLIGVVMRSARMDSTQELALESQQREHFPPYQLQPSELPMHLHEPVAMDSRLRRYRNQIEPLQPPIGMRH